MSLFDDILNGIWDLVFSDQVEALQAIFNLVKELPNSLISLSLAIVYIFMYPFIIMVDFVHWAFSYFWEQNVALFNIPLDLINTSVQVVTIANIPLPPVQLWILFLILATRVLFIIIRWIWSLIP